MVIKSQCSDPPLSLYGTFLNKLFKLLKEPPQQLLQLLLLFIMLKQPEKAQTIFCQVSDPVLKFV